MLLRGRGASSSNKVFFKVSAHHKLPRLVVRLIGPSNPVCRWRTVASDPGQRGAWVTRGETASDAEGREVFIDGSGRLVFGHSLAGKVDAAYVIQAVLNDNINRRGRSEQVTDTTFRIARLKAENEACYGLWQIKLGIHQPKEYAIVVDRDLGGRLHDVCEKYYADAVDSQVDLESLSMDYDPNKALQKMPLRLSCPESLIPGYGWHMDEYSPRQGKAAYPYGHDCGIQTGAFLVYEGLATQRDWEKHFGKYVLDQLPLWGEQDNTGYFVPRSGGWTRWAYYSDYASTCPFFEGGNWNVAEQLYDSALISHDPLFLSRSLDLMKHDVNVKLDLEKMVFPPCWNPDTLRLQDHRDDLFITVGLAYCAEVCSEILYPHTGDVTYLAKANRITDWLCSYWGPEVRMNYLNPEVNTIHCFMGWRVKALVHRYERDQDPVFLDCAKDLAWTMILTLGTTNHKDSHGRMLAGVTCVGVRGCVDYDCTPNLCHEKDLVFIDMMGLLLDHVSGPGYAKYIAMQKLVLPRDSWKDAFGIQEQRDLNLRTNYDNYARGMTNLAFALNHSSDPYVAAFEKLVSKHDRAIGYRRDIVLANGTPMDRRTHLRVQYLQPGQYCVNLDGRELGVKSHVELDAGLTLGVSQNSMRSLKIKATFLTTP